MKSITHGAMNKWNQTEEKGCFIIPSPMLPLLLFLTNVSLILTNIGKAKHILYVFFVI